jgi:hypothetical protein
MLGGLGLLIAAAPVRAHHAFAAEFDANRPLQLRGQVVKVEWVNPHAWIHFEVKAPNGTAETWMAEGGTPNTLFRRGFTKAALTAGVEIVVDGYQAKDGSRRMNGRNLKLPDGTTLFMGSSGTGAPYDNESKKP